MSFKNEWKDKVDGQDGVLAEDINEIAEAVIENEESVKKNASDISNKQDKLSDEQIENIGKIPDKQDALSQEQLENINSVPGKMNTSDFEALGLEVVIDYFDRKFNFELGFFASTSNIFTDTTDKNRVRTPVFRVEKDMTLVLLDTTKSALLYVQDDENGTNISRLATLNSSKPEYTIPTDSRYYRLVMQYQGASTVITDASEFENYIKYYYKDENIPYALDNINKDIEKLGVDVNNVASLELNAEDIWEIGAINVTTGKNDNTRTRLRTKSYLNKYVSYIKTYNRYRFYLLAYDADGTYVGVWNGTEFGSPSTMLNEFNLYNERQKHPSYQYRVILRYSDTETDISLDAYKNITLKNAIFSECSKKDNLENLNNADLWESGYILPTTGVKGDLASRLRTIGYIDDMVDTVIVKGNNKVWLYAYDVNGNYVGAWNEELIGFVKQSPPSYKYINIKELRERFTHSYVLVLGGDTNRTLSTDDSSNVLFFTTAGEKLYKQSLVPPMVTFIDDDCRAEQLVNWEELGDLTGVKSCFACVTGSVGNPDRATWEDIERMTNKGFEFYSHTHGHIRLDQTDDETLKTDFEASIEALKDHGCNSDVLVIPYGNTSASSLAVVKKYFKNAIKTGYSIQNRPINAYGVDRYSVLSKETVNTEIDGTSYELYKLLTLDEFKAIIDEVIRTNSWVIFMSHFRNSYDDGYSYTEEMKNTMIEVMKYIASKGVEVVTFSEGVDRYKNRVSCGTTKDSTYYIVDCNGEVYQR